MRSILSKNRLPRIKIYIDGANFYHGLQSLNKRYVDFNFDFAKFARINSSGRNIQGISYYIAPYPRQKSEKIFQKQRVFFQRLKNENIRVVKSIINSESGKIKGDDIQIAIDMLDDAVRDVFDTSILVSGNGDFYPLVRKIHAWKKNVELWYFEGQTATRLISAYDAVKSITRSMVRKCDNSKHPSDMKK